MAGYVPALQGYEWGRSRSRLRLYDCVSAVIGLFCRQYDIIKDNDSNSNPQGEGEGTEQESSGKASGDKTGDVGPVKAGSGGFCPRKLIERKEESHGGAEEEENGNLGWETIHFPEWELRPSSFTEKVTIHQYY